MSESPAPALPAVSLAVVTRAVVWNQLLWTAGYSLTTGGFLTFFGQELGATGLQISLLLALPETVSVLGVLTRPIIQLAGQRERAWLVTSLLGRVATFGIPLLALTDPELVTSSSLWVLLGLVAISSVFSAIAYTCYLSWLSELAPETNWGRFFARRNIARLLVLLAVPMAGGYLRDWWKSEVARESLPLIYAVTFTLGNLLQFGSLLPLLRLPEHSRMDTEVPRVEQPNRSIWRNHSLWWLWGHNWWLATFNGLTQSAFFLYSIGPLQVGLGNYYLLQNTMILVSLPVSHWTGRWTDRHGHKPALFWSLVLVSFSLVFWLLAKPGQWWWLFGAYALWGLYAAANIAGENLLLTLAPRGDNTTPLAMFRLVAGCLAGLSGLLGGLCLDQLRRSQFRLEWWGGTVGAFQLLFLISFAGRLLAPLWLLPVREPLRRPSDEG